MTRIICISDTHEHHEELGISRMPKGDILIHAGDFTNIGQPKAIAEFGAWLRALDYKHKIVIAGNHDILFQKDPLKARRVLKDACPDVIYLQDEGVEVMGLKIWGSPWTPEFMEWAFMERRGFMKEKWKHIPTGLDILVTHGPPAGGLGGLLPMFREDVGDGELRNAIIEKHPKVHVCGHIHEGYGDRQYDGMRFVNAAMYHDFGLHKGREPIAIDL